MLEPIPYALSVSRFRLISKENDLTDATAAGALPLPSSNLTCPLAKYSASRATPSNVGVARVAVADSAFPTKPTD
mgnify:CR=1 FL=1